MIKHKAILTVYNLGGMNKQQLKQLTAWLERVTKSIQETPKDYSNIRSSFKLMK